jgi:hypothetical protein
VAYRLGQKTQGKEEKTDDQNKVAWNTIKQSNNCKNQYIREHYKHLFIRKMTDPGYSIVGEGGGAGGDLSNL